VNLRFDADLADWLIKPLKFEEQRLFAVWN